jgi:branched-chain amino acid aminotransferase
MTSSHTLPFVHLPHPSPASPVDRAHLLADPGFGRAFTDHMTTIRYIGDRGWHDAKIEPRAAIALDPAAAVFHYAQEIFEGLKAYRTAAGGVALFRPSENAQRFQRSAERLAMPVLPEALFVEALEQLIRADRDWVPEGDGSLYLRPFMIATEAFFGVRPSTEYLFTVIASPVGAYFKSATEAVSVWVSRDYTRAVRGGTGGAKCGGNYAAGLLAQAEAAQHRCDQVLFLDAIERRWIEELGGMNVFFVFDDGTMSTPPLGGTILSGVTREAVITLAREQGVAVREEPYAIEELLGDAMSGRIQEMFACGTAAVLTPIGTVRTDESDFRIGAGTPGERTLALRNVLLGIQRSQIEDRHGWVRHVI